MVRYGLLSGVALFLVLAANQKITPLVAALTAHAQERILAEKLVDLDHDGQMEKVVKIKQDGKISVQIYHLYGFQDSVQSKLIAQYQFPTGEDGFIYDKQSITNLAFSDVNKNGQLEILVSFFDETTKESKVHTLAWDKNQNNLLK